MDNWLFDLQLFAGDAEITPPEKTADEGKPEETQEKPSKTFTQAEMDAIIADRVKRATKDMPNPDELKAFREHQESQKSEAERLSGTVQTLTTERDTERAAREKAEREITALKKGIPADKLPVYVHMAAMYQNDDTSFEAALDKAIADLPIGDSGKRRGVPGAGGNPPPSPGKPKPKNVKESVDQKTEQLIPKT